MIAKKNVRFSQPVSSHSSSQADYLDNSNVQGGIFPPAPIASVSQKSLSENYESMMGGAPKQSAAMNEYPPMMNGPMAANSVLGGSFGSMF